MKDITAKNTYLEDFKKKQKQPLGVWDAAMYLFKETLPWRSLGFNILNKFLLYQILLEIKCLFLTAKMIKIITVHSQVGQVYFYRQKE